MKIIVVGGGIIGCATAYELIKAGCAVTVIERSAPGAEASGAAAGVLSPLAEWSHAALSRLVVASWRLYPAVASELRAATGVDVELTTRLVPRPSGELLIGATVERVGFRRAVTAEAVADLLSAAIELVPALAGLPLARTWYGFRPWAPDSRPILGPWPGVDNLWVATAHYREGILLAPITARLLTEWMVGGKPSIDLDEFLPDRFAKD